MGRMPPFQDDGHPHGVVSERLAYVQAMTSTGRFASRDCGQRVPTRPSRPFGSRVPVLEKERIRLAGVHRTGPQLRTGAPDELERRPRRKQCAPAVPRDRP